MPLLDLYKADNSQILKLGLKQTLAISGDGSLKDNSLCSKEFRIFLGLVPSEKLYEFIESCLNENFDQKGLALQDIVNELGRRLEYRVEHGLYQGVHGKIGYDGIWQKPNGHAFVIEVKTSDTYRINLDKLATYRNKLIELNSIPKESSILIVVGRQDTGDLEAQIRGSRHAWDIRLISSDALIKLVGLKEGAEENTTSKIHEILQPFEYTRLDRIVDLAFVATREKEETNALELGVVEAEISEVSTTKTKNEKVAYAQSPGIEIVRGRVLDAYRRQYKTDLIRKSPVLFWTPDHLHRVACTISKSYRTSQSQYYWYAFHQPWQKFLQEGKAGFFILGCLDRDEAFVLPLYWIEERVSLLNTTTKIDGKQFWHLHLRADDEKSPLRLCLAGRTQELALEEFRLAL